jgi:hypothetical protein
MAVHRGNKKPGVQQYHFNHYADFDADGNSGVASEFYPCKDEVFRATYEAVTD